MPNFVGLDIETTGLDPDQNHRLIQIGLYFPEDDDQKTYDVLPMGVMTLSGEAMEVNGITMERIKSGTPNDELDDILVEYLKSKNPPATGWIATGFNVGGFDLRFIRKELPKTAAYFSHRTMDLASMAFLLGEVLERDWREVKDEVRAKTAERLKALGIEEKWHDAGYDARAAIETFEVQKEMLKEMPCLLRN